MQPSALAHRSNGAATVYSPSRAQSFDPIPTTRLIPPPEAPPLVVTSVQDLMAMEFPSKPALLDPFLKEKSIGMIYAARGVGKTWVSSEIAWSIACAGSALGKWTAPNARKVLYIDGEMSAAAIKDRFALVANNSPMEPPSSDYLRFIAADLQSESMPDLSTPQCRAAVDPHLHDVDLIILDNLSTLARTGEENANESWRPMQEWALEQRRKGRSVLFVHHAGKGGLQRGASSREDILDYVISLKRSDDYTPEEGARFQVHFEKARSLYGPDVAAFEAKLEIHYHSELGPQAKWTLRNLDDQKLSAVVGHIASGLSIRDTASEMGISKSQVERLKRKAEGKGLLKVKGDADDE